MKLKKLLFMKQNILFVKPFLNTYNKLPSKRLLATASIRGISSTNFPCPLPLIDIGLFICNFFWTVKSKNWKLILQYHNLEVQMFCHCYLTYLFALATALRV